MGDIQEKQGKIIRLREELEEYPRGTSTRFYSTESEEEDEKQREIARESILDQVSRLELEVQFARDKSWFPEGRWRPFLLTNAVSFILGLLLGLITAYLLSEN